MSFSTPNWANSSGTIANAIISAANGCICHKDAASMTIDASAPTTEVASAACEATLYGIASRAARTCVVTSSSNVCAGVRRASASVRSDWYSAINGSCNKSRMFCANDDDTDINTAPTVSTARITANRPTPSPDPIPSPSGPHAQPISHTCNDGIAIITNIDSHITTVRTGRLRNAYALVRHDVATASQNGRNPATIGIYNASPQ